jgi:hypothetical protein
MFNINGKSYSKYLLLITAILYITSGLLAYYLIVSYDSNRIYSLRKVSKEYRVELANDYIDRVYKKNSILFIGDSQTNGHMFPTDKIFTTLLQQKLNKNVLNLAFQDARILDNKYFLSYLKNHNMFFDKIIFNVNQAHIKVSDFTHLDVKQKEDYKLAIFKDIKSFIKLGLMPNPVSAPKESINLAKYDNYFDMNTTGIKSYSNKLLQLIELSKEISNETIIYITPHSKNAIIHNNVDDIINLEKFSNIIFNVCDNESIKCFHPDIVDDKYFVDIVHFNSLGHKKMTNQLEYFLQPQKIPSNTRLQKTNERVSKKYIIEPE